MTSALVPPILAAMVGGWAVGSAPVLVLLRRVRTDPLTGVASRAGLAAALRRARRRQRYLGLLLLDLDGFKDVNDTYGHQIGDEVLVETARRLRATALPGERAARLHGDEFALLISAHDAEHVEARRAAVAAALTPPVALANLRICATASIGAAVLPARHTTLDQLLATADAAMYRVKLRRHDRRGDAVPCTGGCRFGCPAPRVARAVDLDRAALTQAVTESTAARACQWPTGCGHGPDDGTETLLRHYRPAAPA
jgi:diguanylate cyclase (GGDEF)-like protein